MPQRFTNADLQGWYGYHRSGTVLTHLTPADLVLSRPPTMQTVASVGFTYFDGGSGKYGAPDGVGVWQSKQITTKLDIQTLTGQTTTGETTELKLPIDNNFDIEPDPKDGFYQVSPDGTFKMWTSNGKNGIDGPVAAWGVLVDNHEYYALSMVANTGVIVIGKKTPREQD